MVNEDENKCFSISFRTPVSDSTGVPHIMEHSVLCGSRKYPIKEPFVQLIKGSLQTFLNAMTFPDRTCYPVASCNVQDFYNLVDIYLDAVFFPNCLRDPLIFAQEGWHYELDKVDNPLTYKGVVFNEMKGSFSSPDQVHALRGERLLFPDNAYWHESGGDPVDIPNLNFEQFKVRSTQLVWRSLTVSSSSLQEFHDTYYHPSNAKIWFSGNDDPVKRLEILNDYLEQFSKKKIDSEIDQQKFFSEPKKIVDAYAAGEDDKTFASLHWLLSEDHLDIKTQLALSFLNHLLMGTPAAPLYKRLTDSNLGESVVGGGLDDSMRQPTFHVGLKGVESQNAGKVEGIIIEELERLAKEGFSQDAIDAAMNTIEFSLRENNTGRYPRGLSLMMRANEAWNYERDPIENLQWEEPLQELKDQLASGKDVFGELIKTFLLGNKHRITLEMQPDTEMAAKKLKTEQEKLAQIKAEMTEQDLQEQVQLTKILKERQEKPDSPEDLKCVPLLKLSDLPKEAQKIPTEVRQEGSVTYLTHDLFTNDILYFTLALDMTSLPEELLPMVPLFCDCLTEMGTKKRDFVQLIELIGQKTGGVSASSLVTSKRDSEEPVAKMLISGKAMKDKIGDTMDIIKEILLSAKLDDKERFKQMVLETKSGLESSISRAGHSFAVKRLAAQQCLADAVNERMSGISYITFIRDLVQRVDQDWPSVLQQLEECRRYLICTNNCTVNMTADKETISEAQPHVDALLSALPSPSLEKQKWNVLLPAENEAFTIPTQVNYVGKGVNFFKATDFKVHGSSSVVTKHLFGTWLWDRVRVLGGAYGCMTSLDSQSGVCTFVSYRDPNLMESIKAYEDAANFLKTTEMDEDALVTAIVGAIGSVDAYQLPDAKGNTAMVRHFVGITDEWRQQRRDELLGTTKEDFVRFGEKLDALKGDQARVVAVTSAEKAEEINKEKPGFWKIHKII